MMSKKENVPEGWEIKTIGDVADVVGGGTPSTSEPKYWNGNINWFTPTEIGANKYSTKSNKKITKEGLANSSAKLLPPGTILLSTRASIGDISILCKEGATNQGFQNLIPNETIDTEYLYYVILTLKPVFIQYASGSTFLEISPIKLRKILIQLPPLPEQHAIAEVLSDMDGYIASLEKLITKKKAIKQGAMQELLTGKRRLPGFTGEWENIELGELLEYEQPTDYIVRSTEYISSGIPVLTAGKSFILGYTVEQDGIYSKYPVILFDDFLTISRYIDFPFKVKSSAVKLLKNKREYDCLKLIFELMQMIEFTVVDHQRHWISQYSKIQLRLPLPEEQSAIAAILSDMDSEIDVLTAKLNKAKLIKQGMMRELLAGRIRLVHTYPIQNEFGISEYMVILAIITKLFTDDSMKFLKHMRYQKLVYLYLVYKKAKTGIFEKWDYGPFSKELAYTVVPKAENEKSYIVTDNDKNICVGKNISEAVEKAVNKGYYKTAERLAEEIRYKKDTELIVLATVIESIKDLEISQKAISLQTVKEYIGSISIWKPKLSLEYFTDFAIDKSIKEYYDFFK